MLCLQLEYSQDYDSALYVLSYLLGEFRRYPVSIFTVSECNVAVFDGTSKNKLLSFTSWAASGAVIVAAGRKMRQENAQAVDAIEFAAH